MFKVTVLGSGTSSGVPTVGCECRICTSGDPRDKRLRPSIWIKSDETSLVVDTSSDFRQQCLREKIEDIDAVLYTHHHFDHIAGFDDLRAFNYKRRGPVPIYLMPETLAEMERMFRYAFHRPANAESSSPMVQHTVIQDDPFQIEELVVEPLHLKHGSMRVNGYRFGSFAYCTDCNRITDQAMERLQGVRVLILDALRLTPHPTHFTLDEAVAAAQRIGAEQTYFTHIAHEILHSDVESKLPEGMHLAYDGLQLTIES